MAKPSVAEASDINVRIDAPAGTRMNAVVVRVLAAGTPILLVPSGNPRIATLEVDGAVRQTAGSDAMIGSQPLGASLLVRWPHAAEPRACSRYRGRR